MIDKKELEEKVHRMLHPTCIEDYGIAIPVDDFLSTEEGAEEFARWGGLSYPKPKL